MHEVLNLAKKFRSFPISPDSVQIIETPQEFYGLLVELARSAKKRITLSTLYIGDGQLEKDLLDELEKTLERCPDLKMNILIDYFRGTRGGSERSSASLLKRLVPRASVCLFHSPSVRGFVKKILPERSNEIIGLQHMKLYIFDDNIIISGANLSDTYFTNRQDRYILIRDCGQLVDFFDSLVQTVSSCSFSLKTDGSLVLHEKCEYHPSDGPVIEYWEMVNGRIFKLLKTLPTTSSEQSESQTRVYPLIQMGMFLINQEHDFLTELFNIQDSNIQMTLASGYFNFVDEYAASISNIGKYSMDVVYASPQANGFHEGSGLSGYIPSMYVALSQRFYRSTRPKVRLFEYSRPNWSFHGKGLWIDSSQSQYSATLVGSSNYGYRSLQRDLEAQLLIVTNNENLRARLRQEHQRLFEYSSVVDASTFLRADHNIPFWLRMASRYLRKFF